MKKRATDLIVMRNIKNFMVKNTSMFKKNTKKINDFGFAILDLKKHKKNKFIKINCLKEIY